MKKQRLSDAYKFAGFRPTHEIQAVSTDEGARVIIMKRRQKKRFVLSADKHTVRIMTAGNDASVISPAASCGYISSSRYAESNVCGATW